VTSLAGVVERVRRLLGASGSRAASASLSIAGRCNICGERTRFSYSDPALFRESLLCGSCRATSRYRSIARGLLIAFERLAGVQAGSLAGLPRRAPRSLAVYDTQVPFDNGASAYPIPRRLEALPWVDLHLSTWRPSEPEGASLAPRTTNQNLERLTFPDASFDVVVTSDVMEHVRLDDLAHREIRRVLRPGGFYVFTVPHFRDRETVVRVHIADPADPSRDEDLLPREYHGDANSEEGRALAYRGYGTDLDETLARLGFEVSYEKADYPELGILNTELFLCRAARTSTY
jgi:SAM-dependent methyltransferase